MNIQISLFRKVVQQHIWGEMVDFTPSLFHNASLNATVKELLKSVHIFQLF